MDPKERNQDAVADENTGAAQPVANTTEENASSSNEQSENASEVEEMTDDVEGE